MVRSSTKESPAVTGQSQGQEAASERGQEHSEEAAWRSGSRSGRPPSVISTRSGFHRNTSADRSPLPRVQPQGRHRREGGQGGRRLDTPTQGSQGGTAPSQENERSQVSGHIPGPKLSLGGTHHHTTRPDTTSNSAEASSVCSATEGPSLQPRGATSACLPAP